MPAPVIVTSEQVAEAAAKLAEQGKPITGWTLRGVIGSGRPNRLLSVWKGQQGMADNVEPEPAGEDRNGLVPDCPPYVLMFAEDWAADMRRYLDGLTLTMWRATNTATEQAHHEVTRALRTRIAELEDELFRAEGQVGTLEALSAEKWHEAQTIRETALRRAEVADAENAKAQAEVVRARAEADGHREANARLQATLDELVRRLPAIEQAEAAFEAA